VFRVSCFVSRVLGFTVVGVAVIPAVVVTVAT